MYKYPVQITGYLFMVRPRVPSDDQRRLKELYLYEVLDTSYEDEVNNVVKLAATICRTLLR
jgi:hypothetical protein